MSQSETSSAPLRTDQMFINMGPQHPSTHGVLRIGLTIEGELVVKAVPEPLAEAPLDEVLADILDELGVRGSSEVLAERLEHNEARPQPISIAVPVT